MNMSYAAFRRQVEIGSKIHVRNLRRPWHSRKAKVSAVTSKRFSFNDGAYIIWPPAARVVMRGNVCTILATEDGPRWLSPDEPNGIIAAGTPVIELEVVK